MIWTHVIQTLRVHGSAIWDDKTKIFSLIIPLYDVNEKRWDKIQYSFVTKDGTFGGLWIQLLVIGIILEGQVLIFYHNGQMFNSTIVENFYGFRGGLPEPPLHLTSLPLLNKALTHILFSENNRSVIIIRDLWRHNCSSQFRPRDPTGDCTVRKGNIEIFQDYAAVNNFIFRSPLTLAVQF